VAHKTPPVPEHVITKGGKKKRFMVMKRTKDDLEIDVGRGKRKFWKDIGGKSDILYVDSETEASDIDAVYGRKGSGDVWVKEQANFSHDRTYKEDGVHSFYFGSTRKYRDEYDRIFRKDKGNGKGKNVQRKVPPPWRRGKVQEDDGRFEEEGEVRQTS
jgi:hypothetical protein